MRVNSNSKLNANRNSIRFVCVHERALEKQKTEFILVQKSRA